MTRFRALLLSVAIATTVCQAPISAQTATDLVEQGVRAYGELEFEAAAASLRRALRATPGSGIPGEDYARALIYLAATEYYRGEADSAEALFQQLVLFDTRRKPDPLVFEPGVTDIFEAVRRETKALTVVVPPRTAFRVGSGHIPVSLYASSFLGTVVEIFDEDSSLVRLVYDGPVSDSLVVTWDGLDSLGRRPDDGDYTLAVTSRRPGGVSLRSTRFPLDVSTVQQDTIPHPPAPADSLLLPERTSGGQGFETLFGGLFIGGAVMLLPSAIAPDADLAATRFLVGGAVSLGGLAGFVWRRPGEMITANVEANRELREDWRERLDNVVSENASRIANIRMVVEAGAPTVVELREQ